MIKHILCGVLTCDAFISCYIMLVFLGLDLQCTIISGILTVWFVRLLGLLKASMALDMA